MLIKQADYLPLHSYMDVQDFSIRKRILTSGVVRRWYLVSQRTLSAPNLPRDHGGNLRILAIIWIVSTNPYGWLARDNLSLFQMNKKNRVRSTLRSPLSKWISKGALARSAAEGLSVE
jgi:hypothetical protein